MGQPVAGPSTASSPQGSELLATLVEEKPAARRIRPPPMLRAIEPPLWKMACKARVDHV
ncbi:hypothetical protein PHLGIDRAFT_18137 [Phlebiopsis gigantea 11061_1 CR5-6]|uniref:Uncharacterized protein n=1 Tax=Phlebiopsis gigantea (strain 11061_1 CR5-6) TaxID=745531 RepID=A0A0C3S531_PHLG1|nr:hypothetical protein PHLGIDRAFT_18137 [Phlebiopsis gigantea 11061_1 CR5-6]